MFPKTSMDRDKGASVSGHGPKFMGAIFMCNQTTKKQCFRMKLLGLPSSQAGFVKNIKTGMFLFLFEHEERKLYGVFEATSDGAMNIVPNAYSQSGMSFPAQVRFRNLLFCQPLSEDEFRGAIQENYFTPHKFHFGLSHKQVLKLFQLFSSKRISESYPSPRGCNNGIKKFENSGLGDNSVAGRPRPVRCDMTEYYTGSDMKYSRNADLYDFNIKHSMYDQDLGLTLGYPTLDTERRSLPTMAGPLQPELRNSTLSTSQTDHAIQESFPVIPTGEHSYYHTVPSFKNEYPTSLCSSELYFAQKSIDTQAPHFRSHSYSPHPDSEVYRFPSTNYLRPDDFSGNFGATEPNLAQELTNARALDRGHAYRSQRDLETNQTLNVSSCHDDPPFSNGEPFQREDYVSVQNYDKYDTSASKIYPTKPTGSLHFRVGLSNTCGYSESSEQVDSARGQRYWNPGPDNSDYPFGENENLVRNVEPSQCLDSYSKELNDVKDYEGEETYYVSQSKEYYPTSASSSLHLDTPQRRTSVFSRLSKAPKGQLQGGNTHNPSTNSSLDQLLRLLSQRKKQFNKERVTKQSINWDNDDFNGKMENIVNEMEPFGAGPLVEMTPDIEAMAEESVELPFLNFKRRSEAQMVEDETEGSSSVEGVKVHHKRKKLVRPSFTKEYPSVQVNRDFQNVQSSSQKTSGVHSLIVNAEEIENRGASVLISIIDKGEQMNLKGYIKYSRNCGTDASGAAQGSTELPIDMVEEIILCPKACGKGVVVADTYAESRSVESDIDSVKASEEKFHVVGDQSLALPVQSEAMKFDEDGKKIENISDGRSGKNSHSSDINSASISNVVYGIEGGRILTVDLSSGSNKSDEICKMNASFGRNTKKVCQKSAVNPEAVRMTECDILTADNQCRGNESLEINKTILTFCDGNTENMALGSAVNFAQVSIVNPIAGLTKEDCTLVAGVECDDNKSNKVVEKIDTDQNSDKNFIESDARLSQLSNVNPEYGGLKECYFQTVNLECEGNKPEAASEENKPFSDRNAEEISL